jgi:diadenylate cyclase
MWGTIAQFRWIDGLDVLIVAFTIYQLLLMFRGTKALEMILGLALVYFSSKIALEGGLLTVNWVLQNLLGVWFLLIIILFQPELRRALATFGLRSRLLRRFTRREEAHLIDELVRTTVSLAGKKIGAIIALERETKLTEYIESGVVIDASLSKRLLESIFYPGSPLHDGAVIVQGSRVAAASCFLPLTLNPGVSEEFGTRHRAAIGLTEETDALAVVVSEETGSISLVRAGSITGNLEAASLRRLLGEYLEPARSGDGTAPTRDATPREDRVVAAASQAEK